MFKRKSIGQKWRLSIAAIATTLLSVGLIVLWFFAIQLTANEVLTELSIEVKSIEGVRDLIDQDEIYTMLNNELQKDVLLEPIKSLDLRAIESVLLADTRVHRVEVFVDAQRKLVLDIEQRRPIMRVISNKGQQFYLDQDGYYIAKNQQSTVRVPVVTGDLDEYTDDWKSKPDSKLHKAYEIAVLLYQDEFLSRLIEQVHFEKGRRIVFVPKIGKEKIVLDYTDNLHQKLKKIEPYYKDMAKKNSWDKYKELDISYKKQVVGRNPVKP